MWGNSRSLELGGIRVASLRVIWYRRAHNEEKPYQCSQCDKTFSYSTTHKIYLMIQTQEKAHQCRMCGITFSWSSHLINHMITHTGEKRYQCRQCVKTFRENGQLITHIIIHTSEKPYQCSHCDKTFLHNSNLICNLMIHTEERPNHCSQCDKTVSHNTSVANVIRHSQEITILQTIWWITQGKDHIYINIVTRSSPRHPVSSTSTDSVKVVWSL